MKKNLRTVKTTMIIGILLVSLFAIIVPVSSVKAQGSLFGFASVVSIKWENYNESSVAIKPLEDFKSYTLKLQYGLVKGPFGGLIYNLLYVGRGVDIKLELVDYPKEWSTVFLPVDTITVKLTTHVYDTVEQRITVKVSVNEKAPAFKDATIRIRATVPKIGIIEGFSQEVGITFKAGYLPLLNIVPLLGDKIKISPYKETKIPLEIQNVGNGQTQVFAEIENASESWNVSIEDAIIDVGETKQIFLNVTADHKFDVESIKLKFTPAWSKDLSIKGESYNFELSFINDGSYKENLGFKIDITIIITVIVFIILIIIFIIFLERRKK